MARTIVITGGGTGGHIFPMTAVADALVARGLDADVIKFVGSRRGQERTLLSSRAEETVLLPGRGIKRSLRPLALWNNVTALVRLVFSVLIALRLVLRWRPSVVVSVGGYAAFPMVLASVLTRRRLVFIELDATAGLVHRVFERYATVFCFGIRPTHLPANGRVTGVPLRPSIMGVERSFEHRSEAAARLGVDPQRHIVIVMTGSLGSATVNNAVVGLAGLWSERTDVAIVHVTGRRDFESVSQRRPETSALEYVVLPFADAMNDLWSVADVALCRAGATTVAELTYLGIPSILVPLPNAPGDHQTKNAQSVVDAGGALMLPDSACSANTLAAAIDDLLREPTSRDQMGGAARNLGRRDAADVLATIVLEVRDGE